MIRRRGQRLVVYRGQETVQSIRLRDLECVTVIGNVELSAPAMAVLLDAGVETCLLSAGGKYRGRLSPAEGRNVFLRRQQFRCCEDPEVRVRTAHGILSSKIGNARYVLQRHQQNHPSASLQAAIVELERSRGRIQDTQTIESMLGVEGNAARIYFAAFGTMVRQEFAFTTRSRRPPRDPINSLLSFGYTLLTTELAGAVAAQGLDPHVGLLHELDYGRPSLALDILEEFRQPIVDRLALSLVNRRVLRTEHFDDRGERGGLLNDQGRPRFLEFYHRAMDAAFQEPGSTRPTSFRGLLRRQARRMRGLIEAGREYQPHSIRPAGGQGRPLSSAPVPGPDEAGADEAGPDEEIADEEIADEEIAEEEIAEETDKAEWDEAE